MKSYKSLICALVLLLAASGIGAKISYEYYTAVQSAKQQAVEYEKQTEQAAALLERLAGDELDELFEAK